MKKFVSPELELIRLDVVDVITASGDVAPSSTKVPAASSVPASSVPTASVPATSAPAPTVSDAGLDNEVSADKWVF